MISHHSEIRDRSVHRCSEENAMKWCTHCVEDIEVVSQGITTSCNSAIVRYKDGVVQSSEVRQSEGLVNVRHLGCCVLPRTIALKV